MSAQDGGNFIFDGYKIALFPDSVDKQTPIVGYLPGHMPYELGEKLKKLGLTIVGLPPTCARGHRTNEPKANHTLTFKFDHSRGDAQVHSLLLPDVMKGCEKVRVIA